MHADPSLLNPELTPPKRTLKAPLILLAILIVAGGLEVKWMESHSMGSIPILHQTKSGWEQLPAPAGHPEKLRVSSGGTGWVLTWGRTALSRWTGSAWQYYKATDFGTKTTYSEGNFALDGEQVWAPTEEGVLHWDGERWHCYREAAAAPGASIVAGGGQVWVIDHTGKQSHFIGGKWHSSAPGSSWKDDRETGNPELARTADGTVWLVRRAVYRLVGVNWLPVTAEGKPLDYVTLIGAARNRLWLLDASGLLSVSMNAKEQAAYPANLTGIADEADVEDVASDGTLTWFATSAGIVEFDGSHWRKLAGPNARVSGVHRIAAAPDGTLWIIGSVPSDALKNFRYLVPLVSLMSLALLGASFWFFQRMRAGQLQQHQRVTQAVQHATGDVPVELEMGARKLAWHGTIVWAIMIFGTGVGFVFLRRVWPKVPYWMIPVIVLAIHLAITFQQSLVKRKPKASDPIGPGAPPQYDWGKTLKAVAGGLFFLLIMNPFRYTMPSFLRGYMVWAGLAVVIGYKSLMFRLMNQAARRGNYDGALRIIRWFHFYNPSGMEAMRMSGHMLLAGGRYREAEDALRRSLSSSHASENYGFALEYLGEALMEQGRYDEAMRSYEAALHAFPWLHRPYRGMAELLLRQGKNPDKALEYIEKIIDFTGLSWPQRKSNGRPQDDHWALKAWALARLGRSSEVAPAIEEALKATDKRCLPDLAATHYRAGMAMQSLGNMSEAKEHFERAVELDPQGRRGTLAKAAMREATVWDPVRI